MRKMSILFGAGAEVDYGLPVGKEFIEHLLLGKIDSAYQALYNLGKKADKHRLIHNSSQNVYLQTISQYRDEAVEVFGEEVVNICEAKYNGELDLNNENDKKAGKDCKEWCEKWYKSIVDPNADKNDQKRNFFLENAVFFESLDSKFNDLRNYPVNKPGLRVRYAYTAIFILMLKKLYVIPDDFEWTFENVFSLLQKPYDNISFPAKSYYSVLAEYSGTGVPIFTTNYTHIAEDIIHQRVTYLHGNMDWFEDYKNLTVYDCKDESERKRALDHADSIFPFLLIPSGVKPMICAKEILEFADLINKLDQTDTLIVVGYRFNSEDNHINSIICDWLRQPNKQMIYLNYNGSLKLSNLPWIKEFKICDDIKKVTDEPVVNMKVDAQNSIDVFEKILNELSGEVFHG